MGTSMIEEAFGTLADTGTWQQAAGVFAGFIAPTVARNLIEGNSGIDTYDELYGFGVMAASPYAPAYSGEMAVGAGLYIIDTAVERFGLKQTVSGENL